MLYERHTAVTLQPALVLKRPVEAGHPVEEGPRQRPSEVRLCWGVFPFYTILKIHKKWKKRLYTV